MALQATLADAGLEPVAGPALDALIGPPLQVGFATILAAQGGDPTRVRALVSAYRERYAATVMTGTRLQPGIVEALGTLGERATLAIASSKPLRFTQPLVDALGIAPLFAGVFAPTPQLEGESKAETLARAIATIEGARDDTARAMIGDRSHDMLAAAELDCYAIGALWGYGDAAELREAGATVLLASPNELATVMWNRTQP